TAGEIDASRQAETDTDRRAAADRAALLTPIAKAFSTDIGCEVASIGVQIHGGMGFIEETGAAQHYRDARILPIYEGTNGIQAIDLIGRKLALENGDTVRRHLNDVRETAAACERDPTLAAIGKEIARAAAAVDSATAWLQDRMRSNRASDALAGATPYLKMM